MHLHQDWLHCCEDYARSVLDIMQGEWFDTGDKAYRDGDGYFWYAGRSDDMFRVNDGQH